MIHPLLEASEVCIAPKTQPVTMLPTPEPSQHHLFTAPEPFTVSTPIASPAINHTFQLIGDTYSFLTRPDTAFLERSAVTQEARKDFPTAHDPNYYSSMFNTRGLSTPGLVATPVPLLSPPTPSTAPQPVSIAVTDEHLCGGPSSSPEQLFNPYILPFQPVLPEYTFLRPMSPIMKHPLFGYTPETNSQQVSYWPPSQIPFPKKETTEDPGGEYNSDK